MIPCLENHFCMVVRVFMRSGKNFKRNYDNVKPPNDYDNVKPLKSYVEIKLKSNLVKTGMRFYNCVSNNHKITNYNNKDKDPFSFHCNKYDHKS